MPESKTTKDGLSKLLIDVIDWQGDLSRLISDDADGDPDKHAAAIIRLDTLDWVRTKIEGIING